jgi:heme/copper-type cytochrome/quinol oxidase subunit 2
MIKKHKILNILSGVLYFSPLVSLAQGINLRGSTFYDIMDYLNIMLRTINPILFSIVFIVFFWGLSKFILHSDNEQEISKGKNYMIWGILVLFILISFRAIISFITGDLGLGSASGIPLIRTP